MSAGKIYSTKKKFEIFHEAIFWKKGWKLYLLPSVTDFFNLIFKQIN